jgi:hypothetical protein
MKRCLVVSVLVAAVAILLLVPRVGRAGKRVQGRVRFVPVHVWLDSGSRPLAAYQFELKAAVGQIKIVGVEGGRHAAFNDAPYYDPAALMHDRIVIAAFNTGDVLPEGRTRIATLHLQVLGDVDPEYDVNLVAAASAEGDDLSAEISLETGERT